MPSAAIETQGSKLFIQDTASPLAYVQVKELVSFQAFDGQAAEIDITSLDSVAKEFLMGLQDFGQFSGEFNYLENDPGQEAMRDAKDSREVQGFKFQLSTGGYYTFSGYVLSAPISGGVDAKTDGSFVIRITGNVAKNAASA